MVKCRILRECASSVSGGRQHSGRKSDGYERVKAKIIFTIGYHGKTHQDFLNIIRKNAVQILIDSQLNVIFCDPLWWGPVVKELVEKDLGIPYRRVRQFTPTRRIRALFKKTKDWPAYVAEFIPRMRALKAEEAFDEISASYDNICLLCAESISEQCHRRLVAEYLKSQRPDIEIIHL